jgi:hypothetical protein
MYLETGLGGQFAIARWIWHNKHCSVKTLACITLSVITLIWSGCSGKERSPLVGTWQTDVLDSEWGSNRQTVTYFPDGRCSQSAAFVGAGVLRNQGTYQIRGGTIVRTLHGTTSEIPFTISGNTLHQKFADNTFTFRRIVPEPGTAPNGGPTTPAGDSGGSGGGRHQ